MDREQVTDKLTSLFRRVFDDKELVLFDTMTANDVDLWTSLSHVMLISEIEKTFSVRFQMKDLNKLDNVGAMIDVIISKL